MNIDGVDPIFGKLMSLNSNNISNENTSYFSIVSGEIIFFLSRYLSPRALRSYYLTGNFVFFFLNQTHNVIEIN